MAASDSSDLFMMFVSRDGKIDGESTTKLVPSTSRLLTGFVQGKIIEIDSFSFSVGLDDGSAKQKAGQAGHAGHGQGPPPPPPHPLGNFAGWRGGTMGDNKYPISVQPITFTRGVDKASTTLLNACIGSTSFESATIVKRKSAGGLVTGLPYLRMDFVGVLITDITWSNDDPVKETCRFISRAITVTYLPQLPDGSLGAPKVGFWSMDSKQRPVTV